MRVTVHIQANHIPQQVNAGRKISEGPSAHPYPLQSVNASRKARKGKLCAPRKQSDTHLGSEFGNIVSTAANDRASDLKNKPCNDQYTTHADRNLLQ